MVRFRHPIVLACLASFLVLALLPHAATWARPAPPSVEAARERLRSRLHELASWCTSAKLFGERYDLYELILQRWPDDTKAREANGYEREGPGWSETGRKRPRNLQRSGMATLETMRTEVARSWLEDVEQATAGLPAGPAATWRARALRLAVEIAPDDEALRARNGEVRGKGPKGRETWLLQETLRSRERRPLLTKTAKEALRGVPRPKPVEPEARNEHDTVTWERGFQAGRGRILGLPPAKELKQALENAEATFPLFEAAFGIDSPGPSRYRIYVFDQRSKGNVFLAGRPGVSSSWLRFVTPLIACWMPRSDAVVVKSPDEEVRLEAAPRQVLGAQLRGAFGIHSRMGWATEGFGLYLVWHLTGTRRISSVRQSQYGEKPEEADLGKRLRDDETDWLAEARTLAAGRDAPDLRLLLGKTVNTLTPEDVVTSYAFVVYLLEGHRDRLPGLLRALSAVKDADFDVAFVEHLGHDVASVEARFRRWLAETADLD